MAIAYTITEINNRKPQESRLNALQLDSIIIKKNGTPERHILCQCSCGNYYKATVNRIVKGHVRSCGCLFKEEQVKWVTKYNPIIPALHSQYKHMIGRCYNKNDKSYKYYGGRGVRVCKEWRNDYQAFLDWALANGWRKGLHIDKDKKRMGNLIYSPVMCSIITAKENNQYRRKKGTALL